MKLAVVLVHYHTPDLLRTACGALASDAGTSGLELEGLVVDNGSRPEDRDVLGSLPFPCFDAGRNLGYAGGVNLGFEKTDADFVVLMNPDVEVLPGCLTALTGALEDGAAAAGPRFFLDHSKRFLLPPTEEVGRSSELLRLLAERSHRWARRGRARWRRHAQRHWLAQEPLSSYDLSGALLAVRRDAWQHTGPFDTRYQLYFEETDWLLRLRSAGLEARLVPAAEAVHRYAQSTVSEPRARDWFLESQHRFRRAAYGGAFTRLLELLGSFRKPLTGSGTPSGTSRPGQAAWLEVSASPAGYPAAGRRLADGDMDGAASEGLGEDLPREVLERLADGTYTLRTVDEDGRELGARKLDKS